MVFQAQLEEDDYVAAQRLCRRKSPWAPIIIAAIVALLIFTAVLSYKTNNTFGLFGSLFALVGACAGGLAGHYLWQPWQARRVFRQQKSLQRPFELSWDDSGIHARDGNGEYRHLWTDFIRWREGERLIVLSLSDAMFLMVPKRAFPEEQSLGAFREAVRSRVART